MGENLLDYTIHEIVKRHPETLEVFVNNGFALFAKEEALNELGAILKLKTALRTKKVGAEAFLHLLSDRIEDTSRYNSLLSSVVINKPGNFNFIAQIPCALKVSLQRELQLVLQKMQENKNIQLNYFTGASCSDLLDFNDCIPHFKDIDEAPDLVLTANFRFFNKSFVDRFIKTGLYSGTPQQAINKQLANLDIIDVDGNYNVLCLNTTVIVVDRKRIGNLPVPKTWGDLLKPEYERKIVLQSHGDDFSPIVLLNIYKEHGIAGIEALGRAIVGGMHPSQMIKDMASSKPSLPPIYIMLNFFANSISFPADAQIIWPEDGAFASPFFFMVKTDKAERLSDLIDFITGLQAAKIFADAYYPAVHPDVDNKLPAEAKLKTLGWDYIKERDIEGLIKELNERLLISHRH